MARVHRIDYGTLAPPVRRADGSIIVEARMARTGVQRYRNADGSTRLEYRPPSEVSREDSRASFRGATVTNGHPPVMIDSRNARTYSVGAVLETPRFDGKWLVAPIVVHDQATIDDMNGGRRQVSMGYDVDLVETPGTDPETGERYDAVQTNIVGNHFAIVDDARAGSDAAVRMDATAVMDVEPRHGRTTKDQVMDLAQALAALAAANTKIGELTATAAAETKRADDATKRADAAEAQRDAAKERADKADKERKDAVDGTSSRVDARVDLLHGAERVLGKTVTRADGSTVELRKLDDRAIKLAVIKHVTDADCDKDAQGKARSMEYIDARFDAALEQASDSADVLRESNDIIVRGREDAAGGKRTDAEAEYDKMLQQNRNGWRGDTATK